MCKPVVIPLLMVILASIAVAGSKPEFTDLQTVPVSDSGTADAQALFLQGERYAQGVEQDYTEALKYYLKAAERGHLRAQFAAGSMYASGQRVTQNYVQAYKWLNLAAIGSLSNSDPQIPKAENLRDSVASRMTQQEIAEAQQESKEWESKYIQQRAKDPNPFTTAEWGITIPVAVDHPLPAYTEAARNARVEGFILIQAIVRKDGTVDSFKVLRGLGYGLDESAINMIATKWRFKTGTFNGKPVDIQVNIEVSFIKKQ